MLQDPVSAFTAKVSGAVLDLCCHRASGTELTHEEKHNMRCCQDHPKLIHVEGCRTLASHGEALAKELSIAILQMYCRPRPGPGSRLPHPCAARKSANLGQSPEHSWDQSSGCNHSTIDLGLAHQLGQTVSISAWCLPLEKASMRFCLAEYRNAQRLPLGDGEALIVAVSAGGRTS